MSKIMTRSIATLGVIVGVSTAAIPLTTYAAPQTHSSDISVTATIAAGQFTIGNSGSIIMTQAVAGTSMGSGSSNITVTSNWPTGYTLRMGVPFSKANADLVHTTAATNIIPAIGTLNASTTGWRYGFIAGSGGTVTNFVQPVRFTSAGHAGGTTITASTVGNSTWTVGTQYGLASGSTLASGNYTNDIVVFGTEI